jgi:hypothetical protein
MENLPIIVENVFQPSQFAAATSSVSSSAAGNLPVILLGLGLLVLVAVLVVLYVNHRNSKREDLDGYLQS